MSAFKDRSEYFRSICNQNKLIADGRADDNNNIRKSYHRINDEAEIDAACSTWSHFPCVVHADYDLRYKWAPPALPRRITGNYLYFFAIAKQDSYSNQADAIEAAYDEALQVLEQFIAFLTNQMEDTGSCAGLFVFDLSNSRVEMAGPFSGNLYGWQLIFQDEKKADGTQYDSEDWYEED